MGFVKIIRPINCLMMGIAVIIGRFIVTRSIYEPLNLLFGFTTAFCLTGASMVVNDYYDRHTDKVNAPQRPIPSGLISTREALLFASSLSVLGILSALFTSTICLILSLVFFVISVYYNVKGKEYGLLGNLMVSSCVAITFIYGGLTYKDIGNSFHLILLFSSMAFLINTGREITKGIVDIEGDKIRGVNTLAISIGSRKAAPIAVIFYISAIFLSIVPWLTDLVTWEYLPFVLVADIGFIVSSILLLRNYSRDNAKKVKVFVLIWMLFGLLAFLMGNIGIEG
jgi:geranylgeranylglycerol-phosphate geranylgeranyltransferase